MSEQELFPREVTTDVPCVTLTGREKLHVEQHQGLLSYQPDEICFQTSSGMLSISGSDLSFRMYTKKEAIIGGSITGITVLKKGGRL
ncbi:MAG: YabP/YqfC family sporulation protein [Clostridia bacterium]|nr:YabP/YqfC family sporulation protein [Clostridia bacterium]